MQNYVGKPQTSKKINHDIVLRIVSDNPDISQPEIAQKTGLSLQTVNKTVRELEQAATIICTGVSSFTGGRRAKTYRANLNRGFLACVYISEDVFYGRVTNLGETTLRSCKYRRDASHSWLENLTQCLTKLMDGFVVDEIGIAVPGTVTNNIIYNIPAIPEFEGMNLKERIAEVFQCKVLVENDMRSAAIWAYVENVDSSAKNANIAYISVLDHLGASFIANGKLLPSNNGFSGEIAYMALNEREKNRSQSGCADLMLEETLASGRTELLVEMLSRIMVNICCVMAPEVVVLATDHLHAEHADALRRGMTRYIQERYIPDIKVVPVVPENNLQGIISICRNHMESTIQVVRG